MCKAYIKENSVAVDCTCGNGHDTLWLSNNCKKVYAFDIQPLAIEATSRLLDENGIKNAILINDSHTNINKYIEERPDVIVFNLGFLPGGDKGITTKKDSSMEALKAALELLAVDGILSITMYPGHEEGALEQKMILEWAKNLDSKEYHAVFANMYNQSNRAPQVLWITKKK